MVKAVTNLQKAAGQWEETKEHDTQQRSGKAPCARSISAGPTADATATGRHKPCPHPPYSLRSPTEHLTENSSTALVYLAWKKFCLLFYLETWLREARFVEISSINWGWISSLNDKFIFNFFLKFINFWVFCHGSTRSRLAKAGTERLSITRECHF